MRHSLIASCVWVTDNLSKGYDIGIILIESLQQKDKKTLIVMIELLWNLGFTTRGDAERYIDKFEQSWNYLAHIDKCELLQRK